MTSSGSFKMLSLLALAFLLQQGSAAMAGEFEYRYASCSETRILPRVLKSVKFRYNDRTDGQVESVLTGTIPKSAVCTAGVAGGHVRDWITYRNIDFNLVTYHGKEIVRTAHFNTLRFYTEDQDTTNVLPGGLGDGVAVEYYFSNSTEDWKDLDDNNLSISDGAKGILRFVKGGGTFSSGKVEFNVSDAVTTFAR